MNHTTSKVMDVVVVVSFAVAAGIAVGHFRRELCCALLMQ